MITWAQPNLPNYPNIRHIRLSSYCVRDLKASVQLRISTSKNFLLLYEIPEANAQILPLIYLCTRPLLYGVSHGRRSKSRERNKFESNLIPGVVIKPVVKYSFR